MVAIKKESDTDMGVCCEPDSPHYPYGTQIDLRDELIDKLKLGDIEVGKTVSITGTAIVNAKSESRDERKDGPKSEYRSVTLQLTDIEVVVGKPDVTKQLYGDK